MIKKIDQFVFTSFIPPFFVAYSIAMFVLLMQVLWLYIDEIAGKGLGGFMIIELLIYRSMSLIPLALPLGMLIASVMTMGNMAERYELSSIKSAGVSLWRTMRSMVLFGLLITLFSAYTSNTLIPISNLKFGSRMFDIQQKKPTLQMEAGAFNYDFQGFAIHFKEKSRDGRTIKNVLIYDHSSNMSGQMSQIVAKEGEMYTLNDGRYFVMKLRDGYQYMEQQSRGSKTKGKYPFIRVGFKEWKKIFDLSEFELSRTNPELFNRNRQMMSTPQLLVAIDSIAVRIDERKTEVSNYLSGYFIFEKMDSTYYELADEVEKYGPSDIPIDSIESPPDTMKKINTVEGGQAVAIKDSAPKPKTRRSSGGFTIAQINEAPVSEWESFAASFNPEEQRKLYTKTKTSMRSILNQAEASSRSVRRMKVSRVKHIYDMHMKYVFALVCTIFVFIGAPMGAIIRKGGFGYPILVSIIFFILFVVMTIFCRRFAEQFVLTGMIAAWVPCFILFPIGLLLTHKAMRDSKVIDFSSIKTFFANFIPSKNSKADEEPLDAPGPE